MDQAQREQHGQHRRTAVRKQGEGYADDRQQPHDHGHVTVK